ncbi:PH domain-containing protein [Streptomyces sp. NPDC015032]|uniref:PH domain-containing protein n=1 Tax=Streptomyces sp. NPDC015032 TaxID=3364937 RepID=UPI0036F606B2
MAQTMTAQLRPPACRVEPRSLVLWRVRLSIGGGAAVIGSGGLVSLPAVRSVWPWVGLCALLALAVAAVLLLPRWWFRLHRWEVTDTAVYVRNGYLRQEWGITAMSHIQTVDILRGPLQQRLGLATLVVTTASPKGELRLHGLDATTATELAERLLALAQTTPGDAT